MSKSVDWKLLAATSDEAEAHLLKTRLESEGIGCRLEARNNYPGTSHGGRTREFLVYVAVGEFEASQQVLEDGEMGEEDL